ncbi:MAG: DUF6438 domain-containing protein [Bacteroidota bacterium]
MKSPLLFLTFAISLLAGCAAFLPDASNLDNYQLRATYAQGPCFGRCPVYSLKLYDNGLVIYEGQRFTDMPGTWSKVISRSETAAIIDSFTRVDISRYPTSFPSRLPDASIKTVSFVTAPYNTSYSTSWREECPDLLAQLGTMMERLANTGGFKQVSDSIRTGDNLFGNPISVAKEELIVHLKRGTNVNAWLVKYGKQNVTLKERLNPNGDYYVIFADPNYMGADELLGFIRQDEDVISAQRNGRVSPRN